MWSIGWWALHIVQASLTGCYSFYTFTYTFCIHSWHVDLRWDLKFDIKTIISGCPIPTSSIDSMTRSSALGFSCSDDGFVLVRTQPRSLQYLFMRAGLEQDKQNPCTQGEKLWPWHVNSANRPAIQSFERKYWPMKKINGLQEWKLLTKSLDINLLQ